jgi:peptidoglycan/LPS O-acetylase OafA/YrhL
VSRHVCHITGCVWTGGIRVGHIRCMTSDTPARPGPLRLPRGPAFDSLRWIAAISVVLLHGSSALGVELLGGAVEFVEPIMVFFTLTGMFVFASAQSTWERTGSFRQYARNRALRVAPAVWTFALAAPLLLVVVGAASPSTLVSPEIAVWLGAAAVLAPNYDPAMWAHVGTGSMNGPLYTVPAEMSFYVLVPVLVLAARRVGFWWVVAGMAVVSVVGAAVSSLAGPFVHELFHHLFLERAAYFTTGMVLARVGALVPLRWWLALLALGVHVALRAHQDFGPDTGALAWLQHTVKPVLCALPVGYLVLWAGVRLPAVLGRATGRLGDWSFGTYLWHSVVINLALWWGAAGSGLALAAVLAVSLGLGATSWHLVEKRFLRRKVVGLRGAADGPVGSVTATSRRDVV